MAEPERRLAAAYAEARRAFLAAAERAEARAESHRHPQRGPEGEELAVDVATLGVDTVPAALLIVSGTHGIEGFAGSALQSALLDRIVGSADASPDGVRLVFVHALNPHGFAWQRRVNEDNVDLNRNFVDWSTDPPANPGYDRLADLLVPTAWDEQTQDETTAALLAEVERVGMDRMQEIISGGQYAHPTGLFYGGRGPTWSHRWLASAAPALAAGAERLAIVDLHTGLGPWGHGELIVHDRATDPGYRRAEGWWGDVRSMRDGESVSAELTGDWLGRIGRFLPGVEITAAALEFGTIDSVEVLQALRADAWLHAHADPLGPEASPIKAAIRAAFADDDPAWLAALTTRFDEVVGGALAGLAG